MTDPTIDRDETLAKLWAKSEPVHPLWCHLLDVAAVAFELQAYFGPVAPLTPAWTAALVGLHDVGKADPLFQAKCAALRNRLAPELFEGLVPGDEVGFRHEARSADILCAVLAARAPAWDRRTRRIVARAIAGHHGRSEHHTAEAAPSEESLPRRRARWTPLRAALCDLVFAACGVDGDAPPPAEHADRMGVRLLGLTVVADWIASNRFLFPSPAGDLAQPAAYLDAARGVARLALENVGLVAPPFGRRRAAPSWRDCWPRFEARGIQSEVVALAGEAEPPGLVIIEAAMGEGKTEAALHLASALAARLGLAGTYVALPTQATSNQMHERYADFLARLEPESRARLVHGMAWLLDERAEVPEPADLDAGADGEVQAREAERWLRNLRRALLAPHAVGTIDQVLFAALSVRFGVLRLLGLANKVLVVDEVHAYDTYMRVRLERVLGWCRVLGTPVILLSATLPRAQRLSLVRAYLGRDDVALPSTDGYPLLTTVSRDGVMRARTGAAAARSEERTIHLSCEAGLLHAEHLTSLVERVLASVEGGGCAAVIVNTVRRAQDVYRALRDCAPAGVELLLFHARFPAWRRQELEREVVGRFDETAPLGRPARAVLVATQVVEQSLDLDFDVMFTELAPVDLVLQRMGRLWRHARGDRPVAAPSLHVLTPAPGSFDFGDSDCVYPRLRLLRTLGTLAERSGISLPRDFRPLIERVYGEDTTPCGAIPVQELEAAAAREREARGRSAARAEEHLIGPPNPREFRYPDREFLALEVDEGELGNHLRAQTREGDATTAIFAITREEERDLLALAETRRPPAGVLRRLHLTRASVPAWWLAAGKRDDGAPRVLGIRMLDLTSGASESTSIRYDARLGLWTEARRRA